MKFGKPVETKVTPELMDLPSIIPIQGTPPYVLDSGAALIECWCEDADCVASRNQHCNRVLEEVDALVEGLLMTFVRNTGLAHERPG